MASTSRGCLIHTPPPFVKGSQPTERGCGARGYGPCRSGCPMFGPRVSPLRRIDSPRCGGEPT